MINYRGPISQNLGYGIVGLEICKAISKKEDIIYWPIGHPSLEDNESANFVQQLVNNQAKYTPFNPTIQCWHQHALETRIGRGKNVALTFFEKDELSDLELNHLNTQDTIIAPSKWAYDIIRSDPRFSREVVYIPMGVDSDMFAPNSIAHEPYRFLNVAKLEVRKGHDILCDLFNAAFEPENNVELWIMWNNPFMKPDEIIEWQKRYKQSKLGDKITFVSPLLRSEMPKLYNMVDCGIFPTRAEGCGLPLMECMATSKPIITTNYSAHEDFCSYDNSLLVDIDELEPAKDGRWFDGSANWAKIGKKEFDEFVARMQMCYRNNVKDNPSGRKTMERLTWENTADKILKTL